MQTPPIINPVNIAPSPAKQADRNGGESSFGQTLSREIAGRGNASETPKPVKENKPAAASKPVREKQTEKPAEKTPAPASNDTSSASGTVQAGSETTDAKDVKDVTIAVDPKDNKAARKAKPEDTEVFAASTASDSMLALVAGAGQIISGAAAAKIDVERQSADLTGAEIGNTALPGTIAAAVMAATAAITTDKRPSAGAMKLPADVSPQQDGALPKPGATTTELLADAASLAVEKPVVERSRNAADTGATAFAQELAAAASATPATASSSTDAVAKLQEALPGLTGAAPATMQPIQQQALQSLQTAGPQSEKLAPPVGSPAWDQALGQKVVWMVAGEQQSASLTLNPPDLGPLQVVLNVSNSQANATFISAQPEVRQALEAAMPKLREMLGEAGIQLGQSSVNAGTPNQQGNFADQHSPSGRHDGRSAGGGDTASPAATRVVPAAVRQGLVDTFA